MLNCIIVDDEPLALDLLEDNVKRVPFLNLVGRCRGISEATGVLATQQVDLMFLDIEMPEINGLAYLRSSSNKPLVILITAYDKYALAGFELDVVDYLLKPVAFDRFLKAAGKAAELHKLRSPKQSTEELGNPLKYLFVKSEHRIIKIDVADIQYIESLKDYVKIFAGGKPIMTLLSLKQLENDLPSDEFIRVHRSFIVSLSHISFIGRSKIIMGDASIPISNFYRDDFFALLKAGNRKIELE